MNTESEFQEIGKKMPYSVPEGFFDRVTEKTLEEARNREKIHRKTVVLWRTMAVAASIAALFGVGYLLFTPAPGKHTEQAFLEGPAINKPEIPESEPAVTSHPQPEKIINSQKTADIESISLSDQSEEINKTQINDAEINEIEPGEVEINEAQINEVLSALSNEELLQLATMYNTDMFLEETENNLQ